jgi:type I restriction enzyme M protein
MDEVFKGLRRRLSELSTLFVDYLGPVESTGCVATLLLLKWATHTHPDSSVRRAFAEIGWESVSVQERERVETLEKAIALLEELLGFPPVDGIATRTLQRGRVPAEVWEVYVSGLSASQVSLLEREDLARLYLNLQGQWIEKADQLATPPGIVNLSYQLLAPRPRMSLHDLTCGHGSWLLEAAVRTRQIDGGLFPLRLSGQDIRKDCVEDARVALWLGGFEAEIEMADSLHPKRTQNAEGCCDRVFSHPPFGQNWNFDAHEGRDSPFEPDGGYPRCSVNMAFVVRALSLLNETGKAVVLNPLASLSREGGDQAVRRKLVESDVLEQIIQLPAGLFTGSTARACIFVLNRRKALKFQNRVIFVDLSREFSGNSNQAELTEQGIRRALEARDRGPIDGVSTTVERAVIEKNGYDLEFRHYFSNAKWRGNSLAHEWTVYRAMCDRRGELESAVEGMLENLGAAKMEEKR